MAYIRKRGTGYQVEISLRNLKRITKTFSTKTQAKEFTRRVEGDAKLQLALGASAEGLELLSSLIDRFLDQYDKKDYSIKSHLKWWKNEYGSLPAIQITDKTIREAKKKLIDKGLAPQTFNRYKGNISTLFKWAE